MRKYCTYLSVSFMLIAYTVIVISRVEVCDISVSRELTHFLASMFTTSSIVLLAGVGPHPSMKSKKKI